MNYYSTAEDWPDDPHSFFALWLRDAIKSEPNDPNAMCLATVGSDLKPSARMVLLKNHDARGFVFYTNSESKKGTQISQNMQAALCFYWKTIRKQIRIEGSIEIVSDEQADQYFNSRHRSSRIGAWASSQSRPLQSREKFESDIEEYENKFLKEETFPRPLYWKGYRVIPETMEFWMDEAHRLHKRCLYTKNKNGWDKVMLYP